MDKDKIYYKFTAAFFEDSGEIVKNNIYISKVL